MVHRRMGRPTPTGGTTHPRHRRHEGAAFTSTNCHWLKTESSGSNIVNCSALQHEIVSMYFLQHNTRLCRSVCVPFRHGPMTYKELMRELPDEITPEDAQKEYQAYLTEWWGSEV